MANKIEAIIFDLDGTMWNALDGIHRTWNQVVANHSEYRKEPISFEELEGCLGLPMTDIAAKLFPQTTPEQQQALMDECCAVENAYLSEHGGILYPRLEETLLKLKKRYKLFVVSNCQKGYIESFIKAHKLADCFDDIECWGNNLLPKGENNKLIMRRNNVATAVYVGDTAGDEESARVAGIPFIYAKYGFGEAKAPDYILEAFSKLPEIMGEMEMSTRIGILGYGNLGRGVECAVRQSDDMELVAVFTRRNPDNISILTDTAKVCNVANIADWKDKIDVMIICGGSATDLPAQTPEYVKQFHVVDSFDTHAKIPEHFERVDAAARETGHIGIISVGWDPGMFSLNRLYANAILPVGKDYTFWGKGVSQGHSDVIRRIKGVKNAKQYTIPVESALCAARSGENPELTTRQKHTRECFVVLEKGANAAKIEEEIKTMPNYFADYDTVVHFISEEELLEQHSGIPHGGFVLRSGVTGWEQENRHLIEYRLKLDSNPEFTASVLVAYARAAHRLAQEGQSGCKTVFDIAPAYLSPKSAEELRASML